MMRSTPALAGLADRAPWRAVAGLAITGLTADSRKVQPGFLFAAIEGARADGRSFIADAVARGAAVVLAPPGTPWPPGVPPRALIEDPAPRLRLAQLAAAFAGAQPEHVVAVTGTNGKTSTAEFLRQIWAQAGHQAASLGTLGLIAPGMEPGPGLTTPDPVALADTLARLARAGIARAAIEASSHGLDQFRLDGVRLEAGAFTNLTRDHLDYHGSLPAYRAAKLRLFAELLPAGAPAFATTALDPETSTALAAIAAERRLRLGFVGEGGTAIALLRATPSPDGQDLDLRMDGASHTVHLPLPGRFQADNALLAAALAHALGDAQALDRLPRLAGVRGRMERAAVLANGATVYVDYAHTPDALERLLTALRPHTKGLLHVVFGAGGDRDRGKRPLMGAAAARHADRIIVTDDNPRTEDPAAIRAAVLAACPGAAEIGDRAAAIEAGLNALGPGDVLAVAGKGHEQGQTVGTITLPFDDVTVVRRLTGTA
ncbi:MAG TPA: UDP-N-acetylmuramoyl-L-alanyl-D-glutamate--2,6-diaminopimelate ligase [Acetobacteraceae bacterium]|nr:UDP-N-acetylmuramoyl-L-alanyl-D-glutamate--2,6-diaminopimelate ligase [Acetobacteraceae bacterium]